MSSVKLVFLQSLLKLNLMTPGRCSTKPLPDFSDDLNKRIST